MTLEYADSHGHLTMLFEGGEMKGAPRDPTAAEVKELVSRARDAGVTRILVPGTHRGDLRLAVDIAERYDGVFAAVGIHPHEAKEFDEDEDLKLFEELSASKKVVAVGEIGLDYHYDHSPKEAQRYALEAQLRFALEKGLPVLLHNRESEQDLLPILEHLAPGDPANLRGVFHSFCADAETGQRALALGYLVSFSGMLTFKSAENVRDAASALPLDVDAPRDGRAVSRARAVPGQAERVVVPAAHGREAGRGERRARRRGRARHDGQLPPPLPRALGEVPMARPPRLSRAEFEKLVEKAIGELPEAFRSRLENVVIAVEDEPTDEDYELTGTPDDEDLFGIFRGPMRTEMSLGHAPDASAAGRRLPRPHPAQHEQQPGSRQGDQGHARPRARALLRARGRRDAVLSARIRPATLNYAT